MLNGLAIEIQTVRTVINFGIIKTWDISDTCCPSSGIQDRAIDDPTTFTMYDVSADWEDTTATRYSATIWPETVWPLRAPSVQLHFMTASAAVDEASRRQLVHQTLDPETRRRCKPTNRRFICLRGLKTTGQAEAPLRWSAVVMHEDSSCSGPFGPCRRRTRRLQATERRFTAIVYE